MAAGPRATPKRRVHRGDDSVFPGGRRDVRDAQQRPSWSSLTPPCAIGVVSVRSADGTAVLSALSARGGGAGSGPGGVYVSSDFGHSWRTRRRGDPALRAPVSGATRCPWRRRDRNRLGRLASCRHPAEAPTKVAHGAVGVVKDLPPAGQGLSPSLVVSSGTGWASKQWTIAARAIRCWLAPTDGGGEQGPGGLPSGRRRSDGAPPSLADPSVDAARRNRQPLQPTRHRTAGDRLPV